MNALPKRILSIDVLRAITMLLMIFVNDVAGVAQIPKWIEHTAADVDGMGFSDLIFPAFLFIVGLSLPFAIQARLKKGDSNTALISYILLRALALIVMGFFHVNLESYNSELALLSYPVYVILLTAGFFLIWLDYPEKIAKTLRLSLVALGILIVATMAYLYKGGTNAAPKGMEPEWWGILGIIGWAYLFSALVYFFTKGKLAALITAFIVFALINIANHTKLVHLELWMVGDASSITLMLGGAVISTSYSVLVAKGKDKSLGLIFAIAGVLAIVFGLLIRPYAGGISKIYSTPAWVWICMGISILMFELLIYLVDVRNKKNWFELIKPAGTSTLTCYLIPYVLYAVFNLVDFNYPHYFNYGIGGIIRSLFIAFLVIRLVAFMEKKSIRLKI
jgi:heparan-alpha-glucosaminide N-acetyltransferase